MSKVNGKLILGLVICCVLSGCDYKVKFIEQGVHECKSPICEQQYKFSTDDKFTSANFEPFGIGGYIDFLDEKTGKMVRVVAGDECQYTCRCVEHCR